MKRSEAIKHLKMETDNWLSNPIDMYECDLIIQCLERLGMLPPEYNANEGSGIKRSCMVNEWEPEE